MELGENNSDSITVLNALHLNHKMKHSIIIICDKIRESKLIRLLNSIKPQIDQKETEVLLIHENNDFTPNLSLPLHLKYVKIPEKQGIPFNRNQGIKYAQGDIIIFIDDDCWVQENWFSSLTQPIEENKQILAVTSGTKIPKSNFLGDCIASLGFPGGGTLGFEKVWKVSKSGFTNHLAVGNCALRRSLFAKVGLFDETMKLGAEDAELSHRMEKAGIPIKYASNAYAFHEARTTMNSFIKWQLRRGRANYHFKRRVGPVGSFVKLRIWSAKNILKKDKFNPKLPAILFLLGMSFVLQQIGYLKEGKKDV